MALLASTSFSIVRITTLALVLALATTTPTSFAAVAKTRNCASLTASRMELRECLTIPCSPLTTTPAAATVDDDTFSYYYKQTACYNRNMPPTDPTLVTQLTLPSLLQDVDERGQRVKLQLFLFSLWHDPRLEWRKSSSPPSSKNNNVPQQQLEWLDIPINRIWHPAVTVASGTNDIFVQNEDLSEPFLRQSTSAVSPNGVVLNVARYIDWTYCAFDSLKFPFDTTACQVILWASDQLVDLRAPPLTAQGQITLQNLCTTPPNNNSSSTRSSAEFTIECLLAHSNNLDEFLPSKIDTDKDASAAAASSVWRTAEWKLSLLTKEESADDGGGGSVQPKLTYDVKRDVAGFNVTQLRVTFYLERAWRQSFFMYVAMPGVASIMTSLTIVTVCERGERYGVAAAIALALVVIRMNIADRLMPSETGIPIILWYLTVLELAVCGCALMTSAWEIRQTGCKLRRRNLSKVKVDVLADTAAAAISSPQKTSPSHMRKESIAPAYLSLPMTMMQDWYYLAAGVLFEYTFVFGCFMLWWTYA